MKSAHTDTQSSVPCQIQYDSLDSNNPLPLQCLLVSGPVLPPDSTLVNRGRLGNMGRRCYCGVNIYRRLYEKTACYTNPRGSGEAAEARAFSLHTAVEKIE